LYLQYTTGPEEAEAGERQLLAQSRGHQLPQTRQQPGLGQ
jgi:hypothetical protein